MEVGVILVVSLSLQGNLDGGDGHLILFRQCVSEYRCGPAVKEVQNPIVHVLKPDAQFMDSLTEKVCFRPPKLMPQLCQPLNSDRALVLRLRGQTVEPLKNRHASIGLAVKNNLGSWHATTILADFAILRKELFDGGTEGYSSRCFVAQSLVRAPVGVERCGVASATITAAGAAKPERYNQTVYDARSALHARQNPRRIHPLVPHCSPPIVVSFSHLSI